MAKTRIKKALSVLLSVLMVLSGWVWVVPHDHDHAHAAETVKDKYLFAYFTGNSSDGQTVHLAVSQDGLHYTALRNNEPVIIPSKGTGAIRDPYIWYNEQDNYYYLICTDMDADIPSDPNNIGYWWDNSDSFLMWRSKDLVHWSDETYINIKDLLNQNFNANVGDVYRAWAPQIMFDGKSYILYFSLITDNTAYNSDNLAIVYLKTSDLMDLSAYIDFGYILDPGASIDVNDADIVQNPSTGKWHLFYKTETPRGESYAKVKMLVADNATGPYSSTDVGLDVFSGKNEALEGGNGFFDNNGNFVMYADAYMHNGGTSNPYFYVATTPANGDFTNWTVYGEDAHNINSLSPRHGSVVKISEEEYNRLLNNAYGITSSSFPATETLADHLVGRYFTTGNVRYNAATGKEDLTVNGNLTTTKLDQNGIGYYAGFNGSQYATVDLNALLPNSFNYDDGFTITFKAKPTGNNDSRFFQILNGTSSTEIACWGGSSGLYATYSNATQVLATTSSYFNDGNYHNYQISYANGNLIVYVDGNLLIKKNRFNSPSPLQQTPLMNDAWYDALGNGTLSIGALVNGGSKIVADISDFCIYDCSMSYYDVKAIQNEQDIEAGLTGGGVSAYTGVNSVVPTFSNSDNTYYTTAGYYGNIVYSSNVSGTGKEREDQKGYSAISTGDNVDLGVYYAKNTVLINDGNDMLIPIMAAGLVSGNRNRYIYSIYPTESASSTADNPHISLINYWQGNSNNEGTQTSDFGYAISNGGYNAAGYNSSTLSCTPRLWRRTLGGNGKHYWMSNAIRVSDKITFNSSNYAVISNVNWKWYGGSSDSASASGGSTMTDSNNIYVINLVPLKNVRNTIVSEYDAIVTNSAYCPAIVESYKDVVAEIMKFAPGSYNYAGGVEAAVKACSTDAQNLVNAYNVAKANLAESAKHEDGHKLVELPAREATHELDGLTAGSYCEYCGKVFVEQTSYSIYNVEVPDSAHQIRKPTYKEPGLYWYSCSCGCGISAQTAGYLQTDKYTYEANQIPYEVTYENLFVFSEWANSNSSIPSNSASGAVEFDAVNGTVTVKNKDAAEIYTTYGTEKNGHYSLKAHVGTTPWTVVPGNTYTLEYTITEDGQKEQVFVFFYDIDGNGVVSAANRGNYFANVYGNGKAGTKYLTFSVPEGTEYLTFRFGVTGVGTAKFANIALYEDSRIQESGVLDWNPRVYRDTYFYGETLDALATTHRKGYTFDIWGFDANSNGIVDSEDVGYNFAQFVNNYSFVEDSLGVPTPLNWRVFGLWEEGSYNIKFDANGGTGTMSDLSNIMFETEQALPANTFTRTGYTFLGWSTDKNATSALYRDGSKVQGLGDVNETVTLYAVWKVNNYTISFDNLIDFNNWNKTAGNGTVSNVTENGFTITSNSGVGEATSSSPYFAVKPGQSYKIDVDITGNGWDVYIFFCDANGNWIEFADGESNRFSSDKDWDNEFTAPNNSAVVKAQIRLDANGSNNTVTFDNIRVYEADAPVADGVSYSAPITKTYGTTYGTLPTPTKAGHTFVGWFLADGTQITSDTAVYADNITVYSKWTVNKHTITFIYADGTKTQVEADYGTAGSAVSVPANTPAYNDENGHHTFSWPAISDVTGDATYTESKDVEVHTKAAAVEENRVNSTCTVAGSYDSVVYCSVCNMKLSSTKIELPLAAHTEVEIPAVAPSCTETGLTAGKKCSVCGTVTVEQETVPAKGHTEEVISAVAPTCEDTGLTEGKKCTVCGVITVAQTEVAAKGHDYEGKVTTEPTCEGTGVMTYTCKNDASHTYTEEIEATGHNMVAGNVVAPTCTDAGYTVYTCENGCGKTENRDAVEATGHSYTSVVTVPTCEDKGYTTHTCSVCNDTYVDTYVDALGHDYVGVETKAPTCTEKGVMTYTCKNDASHTYTEEIDAKGHTLTQVEAKTPTCTEKGWEAYEYCSVCDYTTYVEKEALGHKYASVVTDPTCEDKGYTTHTCSVCNDSYVDSYVDALGHSFTNYVSDGNATCLEDGTKTAKCDRCDVTDTITDEGSKLGHSFTNYTSDGNATCLEDGTKTAKCDRCDATDTVKDEGSALGHSYDLTKGTDNGDGTHTVSCTVCAEGTEGHTDVVDCTYGEGVVTAPTCTKNGFTTHTCTVCSHSYTDSETKATGHTFGAWTAIGNDKHERTCTVCKDEEGRVETADCTYGEWTETVAPTCTVAGEKAHTCSVCKNTVTEEVTALGHTLTQVDKKEATCEDIGWDAYEYCTVCDYTTYAEIPANGHSYGTWIDEIPATCIEKGTLGHYECSECGKFFDAEKKELDSLVIAINSNNHAGTTSLKGDFDSTCTKPGYTGDMVWSCCNVIDTEGTAIAPKGHSFGKWTSNDNGTHTRVCTVCTDENGRTETADCTYGEWVETKAPTCTAKGEKEHTCKDCSYVEKADVNALNHIDEDNNGYCDRETCKELICDHVGQDTVLKDYKEETCLEDGYSGDKHCAKCDVIVEYGKTLTKLGHKDENKDHACDNGCDVYQGTHADSADDKDHVCDYGCNAVLEKCSDVTGDNDHNCDICDKADVTEHTYSDATCTVPATCTECSATTGEALGHDWKETTYSFADDGKSCTAERVCNRADCGKTETATAKITSAVKTPAKCEEKGTTTYTATFEETWAKTQTKDVVDVPAKDHAWSVEYDFASDGKTCTATRVCSNDSAHNVTVNATITSKVTNEPTCTEKGTTTYTATFKETWAKTQTKAVVDITALGHAEVAHEAKAPTCTEIGWDAYVTC